MMEINELTAISPVDGRYRDRITELVPYFSEFGLIRYRVYVEIEYFIRLCELPLAQLNGFNKSKYDELRKLHKDFSQDDGLYIKQSESVTNHDVKSVEYFLRKKFDDLGLSEYKEFIHFGLTSQDVNNTAVPLSIKHAIDEVYYPLINQLVQRLKTLSDQWRDIPMLAHTHGQPASPTRLGKEIMVFVERISNQLQLMDTIPHSAKFGGATGNFNAHAVAYPAVDWVKFGNDFVNKTLGLSRLQYTTQIEHYDNFAAICDNLKRINTILIDLSRDFWTYISMEYFKQKIQKDEVGSSAMPHKVNPIDFENAEGNLGLANSLLEHLSAKLPVSRLQRDLTDSTVSRNIGVPFAHILISVKSLIRGLGKIMVNQTAIEDDLSKNWAVVAEAIQTILRREGYKNPYEALKDLTRTGEQITPALINAFIDTLQVSPAVKDELRAITPFTYTGIKNL